MNAYKEIEIILTSGLEVINFEYALKLRPPSSAKSRKFPDKCTIRKRIRKSPVPAIIIFFPIVEEKKSPNQFINNNFKSQCIYAH